MIENILSETAASRMNDNVKTAIFILIQFNKMVSSAQTSQT